MNDVAQPRSDNADRTTELDALVVGAGFAGLYQLLCLRDRLGLSVKALEAGDGVGGTWYWNRYPGARCDSESHVYWYTFSAELMREWEWSERYPGHAEILRYLNFVANKFDLKRDIQFNSRVTSAHYHEATNRWHVRTEHGETFIVQYLVTAVGCLSTANVPDIPGLQDFKGDWYHTGQWPHEGVNFTGAFLGYPLKFAPEISNVEVSPGKNVFFLAALPIHAAEMEFKKANGGDALHRRLFVSGVTEMLRLDRPSVV